MQVATYKSKGHELTQINTINWKELIKQFLSAWDVVDSTRQEYKWCLSHFFNWVEMSGRNIETMQAGDILAYKKFLIDTKCSPKTCSLYLVAVRQFYKWAESTFQYPNIAATVKAPRTKDSKRFMKMHLLPEQVKQLLEVSKESIRDHAMLALFLYTGLRVVEVSRADIGDIRQYMGHNILLVWGKGVAIKPTDVTTDSKVILSEKAMTPLRLYLQTRPDASGNDPLFVTDGDGHRGKRMSVRAIQKRVTKYLDEIGCSGRSYSTHSLRHTVGVSILKSTGDITKVQEVLRHASPTVSQIYTKSIQDEQRMKAAIENMIDYDI